jgi:predicted HD phosphohydrolase
MIRAAIYARISYDPDARAVGVDRQREDCLRLAASRGWTVVAEYIDNNVSASKYSRKAPSTSDCSTTSRLEGSTQLRSGWRTAYSGKCSNWPSS